jgi:hypothetical protein
VSRTLASAKKAGTQFAEDIAKWLTRALGVPVERRVLHGRNDMGDLSGLQAIRGGSIVAELKNVQKTALGPWLDEAERERFNADAAYAVVIHKRYGRGDPADQYVTMSVSTFAHLLAGGPIEDWPIVVQDDHSRRRLPEVKP